MSTCLLTWKKIIYSLFLGEGTKSFLGKTRKCLVS